MYTVPNCGKLYKNCVKMCHSVSNCALLCQIINLILFLMTENYLCQTICYNVLKLCITVSKIILYLYSTAENDICQTVQKCATLFKTVPICDKSVQNVRNFPTWAQFGTVLHS